MKLQIVLVLILCSSLFLAGSNLISFAAVQETKEIESKKGTTKITLKAKIGQNKYVIKVSVCSGKESVVKPKILFKSDREEFVGAAKLTVPPQKCKSFSSKINSNDSSTIKTILLDDKGIPKGLKVRQIT